MEIKGGKKKEASLIIFDLNFQGKINSSGTRRKLK